jgi:hypothetical protein
VQATATFEAGVNGNTITTGVGEASATKWDSISIGASCTLTYDNTHPAHGVLGGKLTTGAANATWMRWDSGTGFPSPVTTVYGRIYLYMTAYPGGATDFVRFLSNVGGLACAVGLTPSVPGKIVLIDSAYVVNEGIGVVDVALNRVVRVEFRAVASPTVGVIEVKLFNGADSTTPAETILASAENTSTDFAYAQFGNNLAANGFNFWLDDIEINDTGYPGPIGSAYQPPQGRLQSLSWVS